MTWPERVETVEKRAGSGLTEDFQRSYNSPSALPSRNVVVFPSADSGEVGIARKKTLAAFPERIAVQKEFAIDCIRRFGLSVNAASRRGDPSCRQAPASLQSL